MTPATAPSAPRRDHLPRLDAIRGLAILMVVVFHAFMFEPASFGGRLVADLITGLSQGVPLFFVLSGFLISLIVFERPDRFRLPDYLRRRAAKIMPPFFLSLLFYAVKETHAGNWGRRLEMVLAGLATLPNFLFQWKLLNPVAWSLLVEIHFYLLLPLLFFFWRRVAPRQAERLTILCFFLVPPLFRAASWLVPAGGAGERFFLVNRFPSAMDFFSWGMLFSHLYRNYRQHEGWARAARILPRLGLILIPVFLLFYMALPTLFAEKFVLDRGVTYEPARLFICLLGFCLLFAIWLPAAPRGWAGRFFDSRLLQYAGLISYEWFLFHAAMIPWFRYYLSRGLGLGLDYHAASGNHTWFSVGSFVLNNLIAIAISFGLCAAVYHGFSQPLLERIRRLGGRARPAA